MEELLSDSNKFKKVNFNPKHKVNKEIRHLIDLEAKIKTYLVDLVNDN